jgi:hypothetical protein
VIDSVVVSIVSVTAVVAAAGLTASDSKLPPAAAAIVRETLPASMYGSSLGAGIDAVPLVAPVAIVIVSPVDSVTVTGACAALSSVAV